jgi:hypothetical protein
MKGVAAAAADRMWTLPELARKWGWPASRLRRLVKLGAIPYLPISGRPYFPDSEIAAWKAAHLRAERATSEQLEIARRAEEAASRVAHRGAPVTDWGFPVDLDQFTR